MVGELHIPLVGSEAKTQREILSLRFAIPPEPTLAHCRRVDLGIAPTCALVPGLELHLTVPGKPHDRSYGMTPETSRRDHPFGHWPYSTGLIRGA